MDQFKAIESVRMSVKHAKRKKEMGKKIDPGRARLGKKIYQLVVYTSLGKVGNGQVKSGYVKLGQVQSGLDN